ncbi:MAG: HD domain-containing protein [Chloroflexi bacterium]|nr:HD domain-containing protein [Chloroflexota bacterium]
MLGHENTEHSSAMLEKLAGFFSNRSTGVFLVGGYLRDSLVSVPLEHDVDIALPADPEPLARELAEWLGGTYVPLSQTHGVARVVALESGNEPLVYENEGRAQAETWTIDLAGYTGSIEEDLARRDFTVNALALPLESWSSPIPGDLIIDPFNGQQDLVRKCIRAVSTRVFRDDPGRLLRVVRLAARLKFRIDPETARMVVAAAPLIDRVSGERVRDEFLALLAMDGAGGHLEVLDRLDLLCRIIPELAETKGVTQPREHYWDVWGHLIHSVECAESVTKGHQNSPIYSFVPWTPESEQYFNEQISDGHTRKTVLKLAALFHDIAKPQTKKMDETGRTRFPGHSELGAGIAKTRLGQMRVSSKGIAAVAKIVEEHLRPATMWQSVDVPTNRAVYRYFRDMGDVAIDTLYFCMADYLAAKGPELSLGEWATYARMVTHILQVGTQPAVSGKVERLLTGHDLMERFRIESGPLVGALLLKIDEAVATGEITSREEALALAEEALKNHSRATGGET